MWKRFYCRANHIHPIGHIGVAQFTYLNLGPEVGTQLWRHKPGDEFAFGNSAFDDTPIKIQYTMRGVM